MTLLEARQQVKAMSKTEPQPDGDRTEQFNKHQTIAITSQVVPMCRKLMVTADEFAYSADEGESPDLDELADLLQNASDELDELATLAEAAN